MTDTAPHVGSCAVANEQDLRNSAKVRRMKRRMETKGAEL